MNLRDAISTLGSRVVQHDEKLNHDEVVSFIKKHGYEKTPLVLNVEGKKVATNFIATREMLCEYLGINRENLAE